MGVAVRNVTTSDDMDTQAVLLSRLAINWSNSRKMRHLKKNAK